MLEHIHWLGAGGFAILGTTHIYINPRRIARPPRPADVILIGHSSYEFCSTADIDKLRNNDTIVITSPSASTQTNAKVVLRPWQSTAAGQACVKGMPIVAPSNGAYKDSSSGDLGFVISTQLYDIYYTGQTSSLASATSLRPDIMIVPIDDANGLTTSELTSALREMRPRWVIPFRWSIGRRVTHYDVDALSRELGSATEIVLLEPAA